MKKHLAIALLAATATFTVAPANAQMSVLKSIETAVASGNTVVVHKTGGRGHGLYGLPAGVIGSTITKNYYSNDDRDNRGSRKSSLSREEQRCQRWDHWCEEYENDRACKKFDDRC